MTQSRDVLTADDVRVAVFAKPPWNKRGYDPKSVHDFLALAVRRLEGRGHLSADDVRGIRFPRSPIGRRGYDMREVDDYLVAVADAVAAMDER
ncbi:DivIVA domain-containing protein [Mycolicibacterium sp. S2-37]|uniref:DivIVA domain-containing protein n=1 Tax=Mycolicibacterium sp. S2-37 TaxID=2810297 RepID=UPI001A93E86C|nr:DivIVA domain-containing protein [Mycolicibacterium sp. S2-37]MBO0679998.1 DivIVA domain-containing protein [Mycolicibacterium sp. S2-37]